MRELRFLLIVVERPITMSDHHPADVQLAMYGCRLVVLHLWRLAVEPGAG